MTAATRRRRTAEAAPVHCNVTSKQLRRWSQNTSDEAAAVLPLKTMRPLLNQVAVAAFLLTFCPATHGFTNAPTDRVRSQKNNFASSLNGMKTGDADGWLSSDDDKNGKSTESADEDDFMKDLLEGGTSSDATVRRKKKNGKNGYSGYKVTDNRDSLPFVVQVATPDPYTKAEKMKVEARKNSKRDSEKKKHQLRNKSKKSNSNSSSSHPSHNMVRMNGKGDSIASSINLRQKDGSLHKILGSFALDKNTNCGDLIEVSVGDECREFEVMKSRCQYKYAGGKRFVMVRKILEVKERTRIAQEEYLKKSLAMNSDDDIPEAERIYQDFA